MSRKANDVTNLMVASVSGKRSFEFHLPFGKMAYHCTKTCFSWNTFLKVSLRQMKPSATGALLCQDFSSHGFSTTQQSLNSTNLQQSQTAPLLRRLSRRHQSFQPIRCIRAAAIPREQTASNLSSRGKRVIQVTEPVYSYILSHTREPEVLTKLREETSTRIGSGMQVSPEQGQFLAMLVKLMGAQRCIEVGVFTGYSSISVALALPDDGRLVAIDRVEETFAVATRYFELAGVAKKIDVRLGMAMEKLKEMLANGEAGRYDFAFLDADKRSYKEYYELLLQLVRPGGVVAIDNVLWHGDIADPTVMDPKTVYLREFNDFLMEDTRIDMSMVPIGDGVTLCRKR